MWIVEDSTEVKHIDIRVANWYNGCSPTPPESLGTTVLERKHQGTFPRILPHEV